MQLAFLILGLLVCPLRAYEFICPPSSQWNLRGISICAKLENGMYTCLFDVMTLRYLEYCGPEEADRIGYKYVLHPNPQPVPCSEEFYQPFIFTSIGNSQCLYSKSTCSGEGLIIASNRTSKEDRSCRCDYTRKYVYVIPPKNGCTCVPSQEDCSCIYRPCAKKEQILRKDYKCYNKTYVLPEKIACEEINTRLHSSEKLLPVLPQTLSKGYSIQQSQHIVIKIIISLIVLTILLACLFVQFHPIVEKISVTTKLNLYSKEDDNYLIIPGDEVTVRCEIKSLFKVKSVRWEIRQGDSRIHFSNNHIMDNIDLYKPSITIKNFSKEDTEKYNIVCIVTNRIHLTNTTIDKIYSFLYRCLGNGQNYYEQEEYQDAHPWITKFAECLQEFSLFQIDKNSKVPINSLASNNEQRLVNLSQNLELLPPAKNVIGETFYWVKVGENGTQFVLDDHNAKGYDKYNMDTKKHSLTITNCSQSDEGKYFFVGINNGGLIETDSCFMVTLKIVPSDKIYEDVSNHRRDKLYVKTNDVDKVMDALNKKNTVVVIGREGTGKSSLCLEIASLHLKNNYSLQKLDPPNKANDTILNIDNPQTLYIIDDTRFDSKAIADIVEKIQKQPKDRYLKMIIACRQTNWFPLKETLSDYTLPYELFNIDFSLNSSDKMNILNNYLKENEKTVTESSLEMFKSVVLNSEPWFGFPLTVKMLIEGAIDLQNCERCFLYPPTSIVDDLTEMYKIATDKDNQKRTEMQIKFCILVYILEDGSQCLCLEEFNDSTFRDICMKMFMKKELPNDLKVSINNAAKELVNVYLLTDGNSFKFIHSMMNLALIVSLLSKDISVAIDHFLERGSLDNILRYFRRKLFFSEKLDIQMKESYLFYLCERLVKEALHMNELGCIETYQNKIRKIGRYVQREWAVRKDEEFKLNLYGAINMYNYTLNQQTGGDVDPNQDDSDKCENKLVLSTLNTMSFIEAISCQGEDPWIYEGNQVSDLVLLCGILIAAQKNYSRSSQKSNKGKAYQLLLEQFEKKLPSEGLIKMLKSDLDSKGNSFYHYLFALGDVESCDILNILSKKGFLKKGALIWKTINKSEHKPKYIALFLGRLEICRFLTEMKKIGKDEKFKKLVQYGKTFCDEIKSVNGHSMSAQTTKYKSKHSPSKSAQTLASIIEGFEDGLLSSVSHGKKEDYEEILKLLKKKNYKGQ